MYREVVWTEDFTKIVRIPLKKKTSATECEDHRTISLVSHASKILLKILMNRIESKSKDVISKNQFGFNKGVGTKEAIGVMKILCVRSLEFENEVCICFVDLEKAFDRVNWTKMMEVLRRIGVDWRDRRMIIELYSRQEAVLEAVFRTAGGESNPCVIGREARKGCPLSPLLFSIYSEMMMIDALEDIEEGGHQGRGTAS